MNNQKVSSEVLPPGPFVIDRLPAVTGAGQVQVVVRDALGREQQVTQPFYSSLQLLAAGLSQYELDLGKVRRDYTTASVAYGPTMGSASYRRGLSDYFHPGRARRISRERGARRRPVRRRRAGALRSGEFHRGHRRRARQFRLTLRAWHRAARCALQLWASITRLRVPVTCRSPLRKRPNASFGGATWHRWAPTSSNGVPWWRFWRARSLRIFPSRRPPA